MLRFTRTPAPERRFVTCDQAKSTKKISTEYAAAKPYCSLRWNAQRNASLTRMSVPPPGSPPDTR